MFALDLFNNDHERRLAEGAVDQLEQRRIDDLAMRMDDLVARAKTAKTAEAKSALMKEFQKCKAERDSYYMVRNETMGYGGLGEGQMKQEMHKAAERMTLTQFINRYGDEDWIREFWNNVNGPIDEAKWDPLTGGDFPDEPNDDAERAEQFKAMRQYYTDNILVTRALDDLYRIAMGTSYYDSVSRPEKYLGTIQNQRTGKTEKRYFKSKEDAYRYAKGNTAVLVKLEKINNQEDTSDLITLPVMLGLGDDKKKWMLKFPSEDYAQKWQFKHREAAQIQWPSGHGLAEAGDVKAKTDDALRAHWEKVKKEKQAGTTTSVPTEKIPGKADLLKGKGRNYYEGQKKNPKAVAEVDDPSGQIAIYNQGLEIPIASKYAGDGQFKITVKNKPAIVTVAGFEIDPLDPGKLDSFYLTDVATGKTHHVVNGWDDPVAVAIFNNLRTNQLPALKEIYKQDMAFYNEHEWDGSQPDRLQGLAQSGYTAIPADNFVKGHQDMKKVTGQQDINEGQGLQQGDPVVVTGSNEFAGKTGEIRELSPSGKFVIVDLYNHGKHSMHLSDVAYNDYADQEEQDDWYDEDLNEFAPGAERDDDDVPDQLLRLANRWWNATDDQPRIENVLRSLGWSIHQVESEDDAVQLMHDDGTVHFISADDFDPEVFEGYQDFNKVEPYAVCLAGKPVKKFDYYEQARRFHDNWKQKLYREGDKAKADKITLMPILDELDTNTLKSYADKRGAQVAAMKADNPNPATGSKEWVQQAVPAQQVGLAKRKIARKERQAGVAETALNSQDPQGDLAAKRKALQDLGMNKEVDQQVVLQRRLDLDREARAKGIAEGAMSNLHADLADVYNRMAPDIERNRDSFKAGQLYDALEAVAEQHGAEAEFKRMMTGARNRAHMDYDTNPGGFHNWFWYLPFDEEELSEEQDTSAVERAILNRVMVAHTDLLMKFGPEKVMQAAEEVAYNVGDVDEIGTSDVSAYVHQVKQILGVPDEVNEKWSQKYKSSINCANPKGFSQKAHCASKKK
jgi:hypothetical protein